ncbi:oligosaccharide flippase family protein [Flavobacteriaceae bacterium]|nr:oligosaccharide flippase family protein [Flavobacteriaceae bacterium]MDB4239797.1 oligosaccharide flippase family protein [Flavobacteriaceae bacterium]MDB9787446.1 oligosaccharide flippase family protein [Flavobacteriaceae bacterium]
MGIVFKQTSWNIVTISIAILIGGVNTLYFYPEFLKDDYYGLVVFLLATSNLLQPLMSFGAQHTIIKFFSSFNDKKKKDQFLSNVIFLPLFFIIPITFLVVQFHDIIAKFLSVKNPIIESYVWVIFLVSFATSYFEVFYSWSRVQFKSIFGNILKEIYPRISVLFLLILVSFEVLNKENFVWWLTGLYYVRLILMIVYSFYLYKPVFSITIPENFKEILSYSFYILLAGSAASFLIDIDKYMIPQKQAISQTAYYAVAVFIATVVEIPGRAMFQILNPLVAKSLNDQNYSELKYLYKKSSENLLLISGLFFLLINLNIDSFYLLLNNQFYSNASLVVLIISSAKLIQMSFGCGPAILATSTFYRITLPFSISMAISVYLLNDYLIDLYGINGAAISTFIVLLIFTILKILYIVFKIKIQPYSLNSLKILFSIFIVYLINYFINLDFHPLLDIFIRSVGIIILYLVMIYFFGISQKLKNLLNLKF